MLQMVLDSGLIGVGIAVLALLAMVLFVERLMVYAREATPTAFLDQFEQAVARGRLDEAEQVCQSYKGNLARIYLIAVTNRDKGPAVLRNILFKYIDLEIMPTLKNRLGLLSTIAKAAPMLGLLGTVQGMIGAFATIAGEQGQGVDPKSLAGDIGLALGTTFLGLIVSLPIIFGLTYLRAKVEKFEVDLERHAQYCLDLLYYKPSAAPSAAPAPGGPLPTGRYPGGAAHAIV